MIIETIKRVLGKSNKPINKLNNDVKEFTSQEKTIIKYGVKDIKKLIRAERDNYKIVRLYEGLLNKKINILDVLVKHLKQGEGVLAKKDISMKLKELSIILSREASKNSLLLGLIQFDVKLNDDFMKSANKLQIVYEKLEERMKEFKEQAAIVKVIGKRITRINNNIAQAEIKGINLLFADEKNVVKYDEAALTLINYMKDELIKQQQVISSLGSIKNKESLIKAFNYMKIHVSEQRRSLDKFKRIQIAKRTLLDEMTTALSDINKSIRSARRISAQKAA